MNNAAADQFNERQTRTDPLHISELARYYQAHHPGLVVDGKCGDDTREHLVATRAQRAEEILADPSTALVVRPSWPAFDGPLERLPKNRRETYKIFGNPGAGKVDRRWKKKNIVTVRDLPGVPWKWFVKVHRDAEPYFREGLRRAAIADPEYVIKRFGAFVFRHIRYESSRPLSRHAFGVACDIDAKLNRGKTFKHNETPTPWSPEWMEIWPHGLSFLFVEAMESVGFTWGGRWKPWVDPMHFQLGK